jgi:hypothetical protein
VTNIVWRQRRDRRDRHHRHYPRSAVTPPPPTTRARAHYAVSVLCVVVCHKRGRESDECERIRLKFIGSGTRWGWAGRAFISSVEPAWQPQWRLCVHRCSLHAFLTPARTMAALSSAAALAATRAAHPKGAATRGRRSLRAPLRCTAAVTDPSSTTVSTTDKTALELLKGVQIRRASDGTTVDAASIVPSKGRVLVPFLTQFADFDSWELAQKLVRGGRGRARGRGCQNEFTRGVLLHPILYYCSWASQGITRVQLYARGGGVGGGGGRGGRLVIRGCVGPPPPPTPPRPAPHSISFHSFASLKSPSTLRFDPALRWTTSRRSTRRA